jgi:hypothetical protein
MVHDTTEYFSVKCKLEKKLNELIHGMELQRLSL